MKFLLSEEIIEDKESGNEYENFFKDELRNIIVELEGKELWERFSEFGIEMIIIKVGR